VPLETHPPTLTNTYPTGYGDASDWCAAIAEYWTYGREHPSDPLAWELVIIAQALAEAITRRAREET
jgi:hypothetical protein